jgi:selenocysteine lyase/cysteine desulfurase
MAPPDRIYLDNAATSWPKPPAVLEALVGFYRDLGRSPGRGDYASSAAAGAMVDRCRQLIRRVTGAAANDQVILAHSGTDALNTAIQGLLGPGDHVVATTVEHNSVLRPLFHARDRMGCVVELVAAEENGQVDPAAIARRLTESTRLVCVNHASNVTGMVQDIAAIATVCRLRQIPLLVDASQSLGKADVAFERWGCALLAAAGHKGLFGPLGSGLLVIRHDLAGQLLPTRFGGTGRESELESQPSALPWRLESGSLAAGDIAGLGAGIQFVLDTGVAAIGQHEQRLDQRFRERLRGLPGVRLFGADAGRRIAVSSIAVSGADVGSLAMTLDASFGIEVRSGLHCAPRALTGNANSCGISTLRFSFGWYNSLADVERAATALEQVIAAVGCKG